MAIAARLRSRRAVLRLAGAGALGAAVALRAGVLRSPESGDGAATASTTTLSAATLATPTATPTPRPVPAAGRSTSALLPGTPWEASFDVTHSGLAGPTVLLLGGVHGNEPGGWLAADELRSWQPAIGSLIVVPRANALAIRTLERTLPELGDLNRLYPGNPDGLPMARMAAAITALATAHHVDLLIDMHESWAFYGERPQNGTAYLGQTITSGAGPASATIAEALAAAVNARLVVPRDRFFSRGPNAASSGNSANGQAQAPGGADVTATPGRSTSSLSLGRHVAALTPVLVEMGQDGQPLARRIELHMLVAHTVLQLHGMA